MNTSKLDLQLQELKNALETVQSEHELQNIKSQFLGKKSEINELMRGIPTLSGDIRRAIGEEINSYRNTFDIMISKKLDNIRAEAINAKLGSEAIDFTAPYHIAKSGTQHILTKTIDELLSIMNHLGFQSVAGQEIEDDFHNFTALNVPPLHPARQSQDTFYTDNDYLLRTQTSSVQIRYMELNKPPHYIVSVGKVYRVDAVDQTHLPMFHQMECLAIDHEITLLDLHQTIQNMLRMFFMLEDLPIRFRPSYFPFTTPSMEVDIMYRGKWLELGGCGMVHRNVLQSVGIKEEEYQGFAFGLGVERLAMVKNSITDIRDFVENDIRFLKYYS
jgi:phenylalanyl-tRNA synthetase alpha chain